MLKNPNFLKGWSLVWILNLLGQVRQSGHIHLIRMCILFTYEMSQFEDGPSSLFAFPASSHILCAFHIRKTELNLQFGREMRKYPLHIE